MNFDNIPAWILAAVALFGAYQAWRANHKANEAVIKATETHDLVTQVQEQTNGMSQKLEAIARREGKAEGVAETRAADRAAKK